MSAVQHTPGPWFTDEKGPSDIRRYILSTGCGLAHSVATVKLYKPESEADARLIAAAPELLRALHYLAMQASVLAPDDVEHQIHSTLATARAAIAKATGAAA